MLRTINIADNANLKHFFDRGAEPSFRQRSLVVQVSANLGGLPATLDANTIVICAYLFLQLNEEDRELISELASEVVADFQERYNVEEQIGG